MSSTIQIYETQSVIFTDTTFGGLPPYDRRWTFSGGNIASATGATAQVRYNIPGQYTATLTVTDFNNVTNSFTSTNGIEVLTASVTSSFSVAPNPVLMSQEAQFTNTSTGVPEAPTSYQWVIGGSNYSTSTNPTLEYDDWKLVPGANIAAAPGATVLVSTRLDATSSFATDTSSSSITVTKTGVQETNYINRTGPAQPYSQEGVITSTGRQTGVFGYPTNSYVFKIDFSSAASGQFVTGFHSTQEDAYIACTGLSGNPLFVTTGVSRATGYIVVEDYFYASGDIEIITGRYIYPSLPNLGRPKQLYFADDGQSGNITDLVVNGNYSLSLIADILNNVYPQLNSAQSDYWSPRFPITSQSSGFNPVVYSPQYFTNLGYSGNAYEIYITVNGSFNATCTVNANSGQGNEPGSLNFEYYVMQDAGGNDGVATQLNAAINSSSIPGGTGAIEFTAVQNYNINSLGTPANYYGLKMEVKTESIETVQIKDNSATLNASLSLNLAPFAYYYTGSSNVLSCSGMPPDLILPTNNYFEQGKQIVYGNTIF